MSWNSRLRNWLLLAVLPWGFLGCDYDAPAKAKAELPIDKKILGLWAQKGKKQAYEVKSKSANEYQIVVYNLLDNRTRSYRGFLVEVGDSVLLQIGALVGLKSKYSFYRYDFSEGNLVVERLSDRSLKGIETESEMFEAIENSDMLEFSDFLVGEAISDIKDLELRKTFDYINGSAWMMIRPEKLEALQFEWGDADSNGEFWWNRSMEGQSWSASGKCSLDWKGERYYVRLDYMEREERQVKNYILTFEDGGGRPKLMKMMEVRGLLIGKQNDGAVFERFIQ